MVPVAGYSNFYACVKIYPLPTGIGIYQDYIKVLTGTSSSELYSDFGRCDVSFAIVGDDVCGNYMYGRTFDGLEPSIRQ